MHSTPPPARVRRLPAPFAISVAIAVGVPVALAGCGSEQPVRTATSPVAETSTTATPEQQRGNADGTGRPGPPPAAVEVADGRVPDGVTVFDDGYPAVNRLDPDLLGALREAAAEARGDGVDVHLNSGWRSAAYQEQLLAEAVVQHGSAAEAARWVATPETSSHVTGDAVDLGGADATSWLARHGDAYGLCRVYDNEPWHFELRPAAVDVGCPPAYADPTEDPRMQP